MHRADRPQKILSMQAEYFLHSNRASGRTPQRSRFMKRRLNKARRRVARMTDYVNLPDPVTH